jgi:Tfp pilus assembly protein PilV
MRVRLTRHSPRARGSSLIEALVASAVLTVGAAAAAGMLTLSSSTSQSSTLGAHAVALAQQEMEDLRSLVYAQILTRDPYPPSTPDVFNGTKFTVHSNVQNDQPAANMKTITVTVSWTDHGTRTYDLQTIYTNISG